MSIPTLEPDMVGVMWPLATSLLWGPRYITQYATICQLPASGNTLLACFQGTGCAKKSACCYLC